MTLTEELLKTADAQDLEGGNGEEWLLSQLGTTAIDFSTDAPDAIAPTFGTFSKVDKLTIGKKILSRLERELRELLCGDSEEAQKDRMDLGLTGDALIGVLTTALTAGLSVGPQAAAIVAALLVRRLVAPTKDELCKSWSERLN